MKKTVHKKKAPKSNGRNVIIAFVILAVLLGALFIVKQKKQMHRDQMHMSPTIVGSTYLQLGPEQGCKVDEGEGKYLCKIGVQNTSDEQMDWAAQISGIEGATLSNNGGGTIDAQQSGVIELSVPVSFCATDSNTGKVTFLDKSSSANKGEVSFNCAAPAVSQ